MANVQTDCSIPAQRKQYRYRYYVAARSRAFLVEAGGKFFIFLFRQYGIVKQIDSTCTDDCKGKCNTPPPPSPSRNHSGILWIQFSARNNHGGNILISPPALCIVYRAPYFTLLVTTVVDLAWILNFLSSRSGSYYTSFRRQTLSKLY